MTISTLPELPIASQDAALAVCNMGAAFSAAIDEDAGAGQGRPIRSANVRCWGSNRHRFRATEGLLLARSGHNDAGEKDGFGIAS